MSFRPWRMNHIAIRSKRRSRYYWVLLYNRLINSRTAAVACGLCQWWTITIREYVISQWHLRFFKPTTSSSLKMTFGLFSNISSFSVSQLVLEGIAFFAVTRLSLLNPKGTTGELTYKNPPSVQHVPIEDDRDRVCTIEPCVVI